MGYKKLVEIDGKLYEGKFVGKGKFSKVFRVGDRVVYYTKNDCTKDALAMFGRRIMHLPEIIKHDVVKTSDGKGWFVYSSPYYKNLTSKYKSAWETYRKLIRAYVSFLRGTSSFGYNLAVEFIEYLKKINFTPKSIIRALEHIIDIGSSCGEYIYFDFHKGNFGVNEYGVLIFRDPLYMR